VTQEESVSCVINVQSFTDEREKKRKVKDYTRDAYLQLGDENSPRNDVFSTETNNNRIFSSTIRFSNDEVKRTAVAVA